MEKEYSAVIVHYYMQFFPGEGSVGSRQPFTFAKQMADAGHEVHVFSTDYNLDTSKPEDVIDQSSENGGRLIVHRLFSPKGGRGSNLQRLFSYTVFMATSGLHGISQNKPDVVIGSIQPMFTGVAALAVSKYFRVPLVLEIRDLWPDALVVKKAMNRFEALPFYLIVNALYHASKRIVSLTPGIKEELVKKGISPHKVDVFPNGFDGSLFDVDKISRKDVRKKYSWGNDLVCIYTGSFTKVTAIDVIVKAAFYLTHRKDIRFELFGHGPTVRKVKSLSSALNLDNVTFHNPVPKKDIPALLNAADLALMSLFDTPLAHIYFENKFIDYLGIGKPIVAAMRGEQATLIQRHQCGLVTEPGDSQGMARIIESLSNKPKLIREMGLRGKSFVREGLMLYDILSRYINTVEATAENRVDELPVWSPQ